MLSLILKPEVMSGVFGGATVETDAVTLLREIREGERERERLPSQHSYLPGQQAR